MSPLHNDSMKFSWEKSESRKREVCLTLSNIYALEFQFVSLARGRDFPTWNFQLATCFIQIGRLEVEKGGGRGRWGGWGWRRRRRRGRRRRWTKLASFKHKIFYLSCQLDIRGTPLNLILEETTLERIEFRHQMKWAQLECSLECQWEFLLLLAPLPLPIPFPLILRSFQPRLDLFWLLLLLLFVKLANVKVEQVLVKLVEILLRFKLLPQQQPMKLQFVQIS